MTAPVSEFLRLPGIAFDVRSPAEFAQGHIPGAISLPLFSNEERTAVGTVYKQQGQKAAIALGLEITGPKLASFVKQASTYTSEGNAKVYCWRGGMRSASMAWLLGFAGLKTATLQKGYKAFRNYVLQELERPRKLVVLGGMTGSGKTAILESLKIRGEQVIDLEAIANHRGSTYGKLAIPHPQPSSEHFENVIAALLSKTDPSRPLWIEDESRLIGTCHIPNGLFNQMQNSPLVVMEIPIEERLQRLKLEYGNLPIELLTAATEKIGKQLGGQRKKGAIGALEQGNVGQALEIVLGYYDHAYMYSLTKRKQPVTRIEGRALSPAAWAERLKETTLL